MPDIIREHDVAGLTIGQLERARRELQASLALVRSHSPARVPILAHMSAIEAELAARRRQDGDLSPRKSMIYHHARYKGNSDTRSRMKQPKDQQDRKRNRLMWPA